VGQQDSPGPAAFRVDGGGSMVEGFSDRSCSCTRSSQAWDTHFRKSPVARRMRGGAHQCAAQVTARSKLEDKVADLELQKLGQKERALVRILWEHRIDWRQSGTSAH
jgi:hypothetical protein